MPEDKDIEEMIEALAALQSKRFIESGCINYLPPTSRLFHDNLISVYKKGLKDAINAVKKMKGE